MAAGCSPDFPDKSALISFASSRWHQNMSAGAFRKWVLRSVFGPNPKVSLSGQRRISDVYARRIASVLVERSEITPALQGGLELGGIPLKPVQPLTASGGAAQSIRSSGGRSEVGTVARDLRRSKRCPGADDNAAHHSSAVAPSMLQAGIVAPPASQNDPSLPRKKQPERRLPLLPRATPIMRDEAGTPIPRRSLLCLAR